jgi:transketolase
LPANWDADIPTFSADAKGMATRVASGTVINALAPRVTNLIGGSADLAPSTRTLMKGAGDFGADNYGNRNMHFGVREHGMGAILNGMALHRGVIPFGATFLIFSDYMRPAIRLAAFARLPVIYVFTHDSIGLGEDGPTHQPVEHLAALRAIPHLTVIRPADANETAVAWKVAMERIERRTGPVLLALTRQNVPVFDRSRYASAEGLRRGAYIMAGTDGKEPDILLVATGSEVQLAVGAHEELAKQGIAARVVSMPSWELFEQQSREYRESIFPPSITARLAIEAGVPQGWHRYVGLAGDIVGLDRFGGSAPYQVLMRNLGFSVENVVARALALLDR